MWIIKLRNCQSNAQAGINRYHSFREEISRRSYLANGLAVEVGYSFLTVRQEVYLFAALPMPNGQVGACMFLEPEPEVDDTSMFDYSLLFVVALWDYYKQTNDMEALEEMWDTAKMQISLAMQQVDPDGIVRDSDKLGWCFLDWSLELNKQAGAQGVLLYAMRSAIAIAEKLGKKQDAERMTQTYEFYKDAAIKHFYNEETGLFLSGKCRQVSYASQIWLILGGTVSPDEGLRILHNVAAHKEAVEMVTPYMRYCLRV